MAPRSYERLAEPVMLGVAAAFIVMLVVPLVATSAFVKQDDPGRPEVLQAIESRLAAIEEGLQARADEATSGQADRHTPTPN